VENAGDSAFDRRYGGWYADLRIAVENGLGELMTGRMGPDQFCETAQAAADAVKADADVPKYTRT
jgi:N-acetylglucosamine transport system substrate-binding protein